MSLAATKTEAITSVTVVTTKTAGPREGKPSPDIAIAVSRAVSGPDVGLFPTSSIAVEGLEAALRGANTICSSQSWSALHLLYSNADVSYVAVSHATEDWLPIYMLLDRKISRINEGVRALRYEPLLPLCPRGRIHGVLEARMTCANWRSEGNQLPI